MTFHSRMANTLFSILLITASAFAGSYSSYTSSNGSFTTITQPTSTYIGTTYVYSPTAPDGHQVDWVGPISFDNKLTVLTAGSTFANWNCTPYVENCSPRVLLTPGNSLNIDIEYGYPDAKVFGFELQPNTTGTDDIVADFYSDNLLVGSIEQSVSGNGGAMLFAAIRTSYWYYPDGTKDGNLPFTNVVVTDLSGNNFAIADIRAAPEPSTVALFACGLLAVAFRKRRSA